MRQQHSREAPSGAHLPKEGRARLESLRCGYEGQHLADITPSQPELRRGAGARFGIVDSFPVVLRSPHLAGAQQHDKRGCRKGTRIQ
eukprot:4756548-Prymnesium_polylepis.1